MAKYHGVIGYANPVESALDVHTDRILEREAFGEVLRGSSKWVAGQGLNDDLAISTRISIVADAFAIQHFSKIKYCKWMGVKWKVVEIEPKRPRLILTLGGEWNGE